MITNESSLNHDFSLNSLTTQAAGGMIMSLAAIGCCGESFTPCCSSFFTHAHKCILQADPIFEAFSYGMSFAVTYSTSSCHMIGFEMLSHLQILSLFQEDDEKITEELRLFLMSF